MFIHVLPLPCYVLHLYNVNSSNCKGAHIEVGGRGFTALVHMLAHLHVAVLCALCRWIEVLVHTASMCSEADVEMHGINRNSIMLIQDYN